MRAGRVALDLRSAGAVTNNEPIAVRHLEARGRRIPVLFFRNAGGSVNGRFLFGADDTPIVDGPTQEAVLSLVADMFDSLMMARGLRAI